MKMKKYNYRNIILHAIFLSILLACSSTTRVSLYNLSYVYEQDVLFTDLPALVFHSDDSTSLVVSEIHLGDLRYQNLPGTDLKSSAYRLKYRLLDSYDAKTVLDSGSVISGDTMNAGRNINILRSLEIRTRDVSQAVLELELTDLHRKETVRKYITVSRSTPFGRQNFMMLNADNYPVFRDHISSEEEVRILCNDPMISLLRVRSYHRDFPIARPPFVEERQDVFDYQADSMFTVSLVNGRTELFTLPREGFYHFQVDTAIREGFTIFRFYDGFPEITATAQLINPLRYISTKAEYEKIMEAEGQKEAVDDFWLNTAGNPARARTLIQSYYGNVEEANQYFTSYQEGWKTDRGIIYIIFDEPDYVYRSATSEEWLYGDPEHRNSLRFDFVKVRNPFTDNDYMLIRDPSMKDPWYITVQSWRR
jgi:GWxTD domain-containing protein